MMNFEWFVTDIPASVYPRNVCFIGAYSGGYHYPLTKYNSLAKIIMPDSKVAALCCEGVEFPSSGDATNLGDCLGAVDGKYRLAPISLFSVAAQGHQFFGYIPDMYWGDHVTLSATNQTYTFGGIWKKFTHLALPNFTCAYATNVSDNEAYSIATRVPGKIVTDLIAPTFAGIDTATVIDDNTIRLTWESGTDDATSSDDLVYEVHYSTSASGPFQVRAVVPGA
jgi:hypothetical protein